jgi:hypothetical protein
MFDRLYFKDGTFYVVTDNPEEVPELKLVISSGVMLTSGAADEQKRLPTDKDMKIISTEDAKKLLGTQAERLDGVTVRSSYHPLLCTTLSVL